MRITCVKFPAVRTALLSAALVTGLLVSPAWSQSEVPKGDAEVVPGGAAKNFGPRKGAPQQAGKRPQAPPVEVVATHGAWSVQCMEAPANPETGQQGGKSCGMTQQAKSEKNERVGLSIIVNRVKRQDKSATFMRLLAPVGVYLPTGIPIEIDGTALPSRMAFLRCTAVCEAMGEMSPDTLAKFKKGGASTFYLYDRPGNGYPIVVKLDGFAAALGALDKL